MLIYIYIYVYMYVNVVYGIQMRDCIIRGQLAEHKQNKDKFFDTQ